MPAIGWILTTLFIAFTAAIVGFTVWLVRKATRKSNEVVPALENLRARVDVSSEADASRRKLLDVGASGRARVIAIAHTGTSINEQPECRVELEIMPDVGQPYTVETVQVIDIVAIPRVQPGLAVAVRIDTADPRSVFIDI